MALRLAAACVLACVAPSVSIGGLANKYLIISAPARNRVVYAKLWRDGKGADEPKVLNSDLQHPQGLAVDQGRSKLYVADPTQAKVVRFDLTSEADGLSTSALKVVLSGVEARWVAVDTVGNLFVSDESKNEILKVAGDKVLKGSAIPSVVYSGQNNPRVSAPGGVAADNFFLFWTNKEVGTAAGSVVKGFEAPHPPERDEEGGAESTTSLLAQNQVKTYGVCLDLDNVYYTGDNQRLYGTKKLAGASPVEISSALSKPRGCAWDGEGTVFVADRQLNQVFSFAGNMKDLTGTSLNKVVAYDDAFGLAVYSGALGRGAHALGLALAAALLAAAPR